MKVLYLTNQQVPYRVRFFNELAKYCDLTVLYEHADSGNRDADWATQEIRWHRTVFLTTPLDLRTVLQEVSSGYDAVILGCCNSFLQLLAMVWMELRGILYLLNLDGEPFLQGKGWKVWLKRQILSIPQYYLAAGEKAVSSLKNALGDKTIFPYPFSSLSDAELQANASAQRARGKTVLVAAQYLHCKGNDVALECARMDGENPYLFVGMGEKTEAFREKYQGIIPENVTILPFLQKEELFQVYKNCAMLVLPSRQECWGLVIPEAASFGVPIVSTWGSGAAVEFLADAYPKYLAEPGNPQSLYQCIQALKRAENSEDYQAFLQKKASEYSIEKSVQAHLQVLREVLELERNH